MNEGVAELRIPTLRANLPNNFYSIAKRQGALVGCPAQEDDHAVFPSGRILLC